MPWIGTSRRRPVNFHVTTLGSEGLLHITGPDALGFLQGQTTCDTRKLDATTALPGAYCTPQGRVVCDFLLARPGAEHIVLRMRRDIMAAAAATFGKYIVFARAELDASREEWQVLACWGADAAAGVKLLCGAVPGGRYGAAGGDGLVVIQLDAEGTQFECYVDRARHPELPPPWSGTPSPGGENHWRVLQIASGIGRIEEPTIATFVPQMLNYDLTGFISFNKGCYTGQEVVARLHYRGKAKRRMYLASFDGPTDTAAGTEVYTADGGQSVGTIVNCAAQDDGTALGLVVATAGGVAGGLHLGGPGGAALTIGHLPYPVE